MERSDSPWRQPVVWLLVLIPLASMVAAGMLVFEALRSSGSDDPVADPVRRTAQIQVVDLGPDARASRDGLSAVVRIAPGFVEVLPVTGQFAPGQTLRLLLQHPAHAEQDRALLLPPGGNGWRVPARIAMGHEWRVQLTANDTSWRLTGRLPKGQQAARLAPAL